MKIMQIRRPVEILQVSYIQISRPTPSPTFGDAFASGYADRVYHYVGACFREASDRLVVR